MNAPLAWMPLRVAGALGVSLAGTLVFSETPTAARLLCMALVCVGIAGLKALSPP